MQHVPITLKATIDSAVLVCRWKSGTTGLCMLEDAGVWASSPPGRDRVEVLLRLKKRLRLQE